MKNAVFWDVTPCGSCKNRRFGGKYCLHHQSKENHRARINISIVLQLLFTANVVPSSVICHPNDGGDMFLRNVGSSKGLTVSHPRRRNSSSERLFHMKIASDVIWTNQPTKSYGKHTKNHLKNGVFWVVTPCVSRKYRRFGGTWRLLHQGDKNRWTRNNTSCN
jgi:hypothetical protein